MQQINNGFVRNEKGAVAIITALCILLLLTFLAGAIDFARIYMVKHRLQAAFDAASLAGVISAESLGFEEEFENVVRANYPTDYMGAPATWSIEVNELNRIYTVNMTATVPTIFLGITGINNVNIGADLEVTKIVENNTRTAEISFVLDSTGSMNFPLPGAAGGGKRIDALRTAATKFINDIFTDKSDLTRISFNFVPFGMSVGIDNREWTKMGPTPYSDGFIGFATTRTDILGEINGRNSTGGRGNGRPYAGLNPNAEVVFDFSDAAPVTPPNPEAVNLPVENFYRIDQSYNYGPTIGPTEPYAIRFGVKNKAAALDAINDITPKVDGATRTNIGILWGLQTLSPSWRGVWPGPADLPRDYDDPKNSKYIILMSDGQNTWALPEDDDHLSALCTNIKAKNIIIYTIALDIEDEAAKALLRDCANTGNSFEVNNASELSAAFTIIAQDINKLYIWVSE